MAVIRPSSISGITSITSPSSSDLLSIHTNNTTEVARVTTSGLSVTGVITATSFDAPVTGDFSIADKIVHTGDTNTAIRFPAADTFTVETAGSERLRIRSDGKVGIGTDNPVRPLHIEASDCRIRLTDSDVTTDVELQNNSGDAVLTTNGASNLSLQTNNTERLRIDANGRLLVAGTASGDVHSDADDVVIGNTSASLMGLSIVTSTSGYATLNFTDGAGDKNQGMVAYNHSNDTLNFSTSSTKRVTIDSSGKVLIGDDSSVGSGKIQAFASQDAVDILSYSTTNTHGGRLTFYRSKNATIGSNTEVAAGDSLGRIDWRGYNDDGTTYNQGARIEALVDGAVNSSTDMPSALVFKTSADGSSTPSERLRIASDGKLTIKNASGMMIDLQSSSGTGSAYIEFSDTDGTRKGYFGYGSSSSEKVYWVQQKSANMSMYSNGNDRFEVQSDGKKIVKNGNLNISSTYIDFSGSLSSTPATAAAIFRPADNTLAVSTANTERLRITSSGYVGINTTTPERYLHIVGNDGATGATLGNSDSTMVLDNKGGNGAMIEFLGGNTGAGRIMFTDTDGSNRGRMEYSHNGDYLRFDTAGSERVRIDSSGSVEIQPYSSQTTAVVDLADNLTGGLRIAVNDETISPAINAPRNGCIMCLTVFSTYPTYPQPGNSGFVYLDVGSSKRIDVLDLGTAVGVNIVGKTTYTSTVGDCDNGKLTVMVGQSAGTFHLVNRCSDWNATWTITFL